MRRRALPCPCLAPAYEHLGHEVVPARPVASLMIPVCSATFSYASGSSDSQLEPCLDRLGIGRLDWRLPSRPYVQDLDHEVRVDMMLGIALGVPGQHIPPSLSLGGLAARRTSSSAHRVSTCHKCAQRVHASAPSIEAPRVEKGIVAWPSHAAMPLYISGRAAVASRPGVEAPSVRSAGSRHFVSQNVTL